MNARSFLAALLLTLLPLGAIGGEYGAGAAPRQPKVVWIASTSMQRRAIPNWLRCAAIRRLKLRFTSAITSFPKY